MSQESNNEKTEAPTPHQLKKAREEGQIPRSRELTSWLMLFAGLMILWLGGAYIAGQLTAMLSSGLRFDHGLINDDKRTVGHIAALLRHAVWSIAPLLAGLMMVAITAPMLLGGINLNKKVIKFNFGKMNPLKGLKRMVSAQTWAELLKAIMKSILVGSIVSGYLWVHLPDMLSLIFESPLMALRHALNMIAIAGLFILLGLLPMVGYDLFWQWYSHLKKLRMSHQEIRDEFKQQEGDPHIKGRIRQQIQAVMYRRMMKEVPQADVVVNNPTHYAVALRYDEKKMHSPKVLAKGAGEMALRIRKIAKEHRVPMLEAPPLARALYRHCEIGQYIPAALYAAVAQVLAWVWRLQHWKVQGGMMPQKPEHLPVPDTLNSGRKKKTNG